MFDSFRLRMLNREASSSKNKANEIIYNLNISKGEVIGDVGCGGGYFTIEFAKMVGENGTVYAMDTNLNALKYVEVLSQKNNLRNIKTFHVKNTDLDIPEKTFDLLFYRNVFHHIPEQSEYFNKMAKYLKKDGLVAIVEYSRKNNIGFTSIFGHNTSERKLVEKMEKAGYVYFKKFNFLPDQNFILFKSVML